MKDTSGPAFPCDVWEYVGPGFCDYEKRSKEGITIRDYMAAKAMQAYLSDKEMIVGLGSVPEIASVAYGMADAMLAEREK